MNVRLKRFASDVRAAIRRCPIEPAEKGAVLKMLADEQFLQFTDENSEELDDEGPEDGEDD